METTINTQARRVPWNKGRLIGQRPPLKQKEVWAIRIRLQLAHEVRDLALFNLAIDSKLRGCDLVKLRVCDVMQGARVSARAMVMQQKTHRPVQFEITDQGRGRELDHPRTLACRRLFISKPNHQVTPPLDTAIRKNRESLGGIHWIRSSKLWNPFDAPY